MAPLEIHVAGGGIGESIVLRLPNDKWGVVDCYVPALSQPETSPSFRFLREKGVVALEFLCLTHPDHDHFRGMHHFLETFEVGQFWIFGAMSPAELYRRVAAFLRIKAESLHDPLDATEDADDFAKTLRLVNTRRARKQISIVKMLLGQPLYQIPQAGDAKPLRITALGPSGNSVSNYEKSLETCFDKSDPNKFLAAHAPKVGNNRVSAALQIEYGDTNVLLGGDMVREGWKDALNWSASTLRLKATLVKASHHGSTNGYCDRLWEDHFSPDKTATSVVTAYCRKGLPPKEGVSHMKANTQSVYTTSKTALHFRTGRTDGRRRSAFRLMPVDAVAALEQTFLSARPKFSEEQGICSFALDDSGRFEVLMTGDASRI